MISQDGMYVICMESSSLSHDNVSYDDMRPPNISFQLAKQHGTRAAYTKNNLG